MILFEKNKIINVLLFHGYKMIENETKLQKLLVHIFPPGNEVLTRALLDIIFVLWPKWPTFFVLKGFEMRRYLYIPRECPG